MSDFNPIGALTEDEKRKIILPPQMPQKNESKIIIGLTGHADSGKTEIAKKFGEGGFEIFIFSDILKREAENRGLLTGNEDEDKLLLSKLGDIVRFISGKKDILADALVREIISSLSQKFVVSGFRSEDEVFLFRKSFQNFKLIRIETNTNGLTDKARIRDEIDMKNKGTDKVFRMADAKIINNGNLEQLNSQLERFITL